MLIYINSCVIRRNYHERNQLIISIEKLRREIIEMAAKKGFLHKEVQHKSQELDKLLNKYNNINCNVSNK